MPNSGLDRFLEIISQARAARVRREAVKNSHPGVTSTKVADTPRETAIGDPECKDIVPQACLGR